MESPLVSIIVPTYNVEKYIAQTIECVLAQSFTNWELVITDDCSKDSTIKIIEKYAQEDERIKLHILSQNSGAATARNHSIEKSIGRYIAFLDGDDWWYPEKLEKQMKFFQQTHCEFCFTAFEYADEKLNVTGVSHKPKKITYRDIKLGCNIGTPGVIYDTLRIGKMYMPDIALSEDWSLWINIIEKTRAAYSINEPLWKYRILSNSLSRNKLKLIKGVINTYKQVLGYSKIKSFMVFVFGFAPNQICKIFYNKIDSFLYVSKAKRMRNNPHNL